MPIDSRNCKSQTESCNMTGGGKKYVGSILPGSIIHFLRSASWSYWGSTRKKMQKKESKAYWQEKVWKNGSRRSKKKNKKYLKLTAGNFFCWQFFCACTDSWKIQHIKLQKKTKNIRKEIRKKNWKWRKFGIMR